MLSIANNMGLTSEQFIRQYTDRRWPAEDTFLIRHDGEYCVFLKFPANDQKLCQIHSFKPKSCRDWEFEKNRSECREGLNTKWRLRLDSDGKISGPPEMINKFKDYLKFLASS